MSNPDIYFIPVPNRVIEEMLSIAGVGNGDVVYDLGCGDGRIVIAAARSRGARGVGIDIDEALIAESHANAVRAEVDERVEFLRQDFFDADLRNASVVALYLIDSLNVRLRPKILAECQPGTRVVSYSFEMGEWEPDAYTPIAANGVLLWVVPANMTGTWRVDVAGQGARLEMVTIDQKFQKISGSAVVNGERLPIRAGSLAGDRFALVVERSNGEEVLHLSGQICGNSMKATVRSEKLDTAWSAEREADTKRALE